MLAYAPVTVFVTCYQARCRIRRTWNSCDVNSKHTHQKATVTTTVQIIIHYQWPHSSYTLWLDNWDSTQPIYQKPVPTVPKASPSGTQLRTELLLHPFNSLFSTTTWVSRYQKGKTSLDLNLMGFSHGSVISWTIRNNLHLARDRQPHQHLITQFLQAGCSSRCPTNSVKALQAKPQNRRPVKTKTGCVPECISAMQ